SGSGPNDRDQLIWGHKIFLVLADYLTRQGIAVLRYDDRGVGRSTGDYDRAAFEEFKRDALAGLDYLAQRQEIDTGQIGLIGHSEGGAIAILAAPSSADLAYLVLMAAPGPLSDFSGLVKQFADSYRANGAAEEAISVKCRVLEEAFWVIRREDDLSEAESKVRQVLRDAESDVAQLSEDQRRKVQLESLDTFDFGWMLSPGFRSILRYDAKEPLMKIKSRVLALNGAKDAQMPAENLTAIGAALAAGGNHDYVSKELPGLNHLFQTATTGSPAEYTQIEETMSPTALNIVSDWILKKTPAR
ncbi:MAG: alpha/beta fold hydrolase, partial [Phycisphaerales bacterium]